MKKGFTLADLLIDLALLGCILALILSTVFKNIQDRPNVKVIKMQQKVDYDFSR